MNKNISHVIIQAGGRGSRLGYLTDNKPKALVSINGEPLIINQMRKYPKATFYIIVDYQRDVFARYLRLFAPAKYRLIIPEGKKTCSGIKKALSYIPEGQPFLMIWCDLYFLGSMLPKRISPRKYNYIGLSRTFPCRWSFQKGRLVEEKSITKGIAGLFVFKNKQEIRDVPQDGEFCQYLQEKQIQCRPFFLQKVNEVGTIDAYESIKKTFHYTRPFNKLSIKKDTVIKTPKDVQGRQLAKHERHWYKVIEVHKKMYIPTIYKTAPLIIERIEGGSLHTTSLTNEQKKQVLSTIINNIHELHNLFPKKEGSYSNDHEAILGKTKKRLDTISSLISDINKPYFFINGKRCTNFYKKWHLVEKMLKPFFGNSYSFIHGDPTFSNLLYEEKTAKPYFIDPRGYYGTSLLYGDEDYDWAKLYYSLVGNYDQFNNKNFRVSLHDENKIVTIDSNQWEHLAEMFFRLTNRDKRKIEAYHAIIWLSLASYVWDDYDSIGGAFYNGIYLMQGFYETVL